MNYKNYLRILIICGLVILIISDKYKIYPSNNDYQDTFDSFYLSVPFDTLDSLMKYYESEGYNYLVKENYEEAYSFLIKSHNIKKEVLSETDLRLGNSYVNLGVLYYNTWRFEEALASYKEAEIIYRRIDSNYYDLGSVYINQAIVFRILGDYEKAKIYCNNGIRIYKKQSNIDYNLLSKAYYNLGIIYQYAEEYSDAIQSFTKALQYDRSNNQSDELNIVSSIAICYDRLHKNDQARKYYIDAIKIANSYYGYNNPENAPFLMNLGLFYIEKLNNFKSGKELYDNSLELYYRAANTKYTEISRCYFNIGEFYYLYHHDYKLALKNIQKSLIFAEPDFNDTSIYSNPTFTNNILNVRLLESIKLKGRILLDSYRKNRDIKDLETSLNTFELAIQNIDRIRIRFDSEESRFIISRQQYETFKQAIVVASLLYEKTKNPIYLQKAMEFNEKARAFSLLISIRNLSAKQFGGIPQELLTQEKDLSRQLALYEELIFEEKKKDQQDLLKIEQWEEKLFWLKQQNDQLLYDFERSYPEYYELKYDTKVIPIGDLIKSLKKDETLIEYTVTDSIIYMYVFSQNSYNLIQSKVDSNFFIDINILRTYLTQPSFSSDVTDQFKEYCKSSYNIYRTLIDPCKNKIIGKTIIIIPDGLLSYIPFEALLTFPEYSNTIKYKNLPYLIKEYAINYAYSATLYCETNDPQVNPTKELLAFAPDYSNLYSQNQMTQINQDFLDAYRDNLIPIPGVKDEVRTISRLISGDVYTDDEATESRFKEMAGDYKILHLAMHTVVNNEDPMYSKLAFQQNVDNENDGFLNTYEIYNMRYNARMAVLSSCNTGYGKFMKGEGVMSLARGFMYAGCPSIVMTLWEVSDKSGAQLMQSFYKNLKAGKSKAEALQQAKLNFLKNADNLRANPYFWSSYVIIGDTNPLYPKSYKTFYWLTGIFILFVIVIAGFIRIRKKSRKKEIFKPDSIYS